MTEKQARFCREYMIDLNGTQAAIRAGYSPQTAREQAHALFTKLHIQNEIARLQAEQSRRTGVNADRVIRELAEVAFATPGDENGIPVRTSDKVKALDLLGRHFGLFRDNAVTDVEDIEAARSEVYDED